MHHQIKLFTVGHFDIQCFLKDVAGFFSQRVRLRILFSDDLVHLFPNLLEIILLHPLYQISQMSFKSIYIEITVIDIDPCLFFDQLHHIVNDLIDVYLSL